MKAAVISEQGLRPEMEDTHFLDLNFGGKGWVFGGVYDGHGGSFAADYAAKKLHQVFLSELLADLSPQEAFISSYETISNDLKDQKSGTTAVNFFIQDETIYTANVGDARAIIIGHEGLKQLTIDHRLDNPNERERIQKAGGAIHYPYTYRGDAGLMPTRTIGDPYFKPVGITATPSVNEYHFTSDDFMLIAACDGLFDFMNNEEVAEIARRTPQPEPLLVILKEKVLLQRRGTDNFTIIALDLG